MYQEKKRERRRRDFLRMKERARKVQVEWWIGFPHTETEIDIASSKLANNLKICSCYICGNPRKWWRNEKTFQEMKADIYGKEED